MSLSSTLLVKTILLLSEVIAGPISDIEELIEGPIFIGLNETGSEIASFISEIAKSQFLM